MKVVFTVSFLLCFTSALIAQERTISGILTSSEDGSPLPGVNIVIKGTNVGTVTDANGYYSITAPVGSVLIFSFVGMVSKEVLVTAENLTTIHTRAEKRIKDKQPRLSQKPPGIPTTFLEDSVPPDIAGVAHLTDDTPSYRNAETLNPSNIHGIRKRGRHFVVRQYQPPAARQVFGLQFTTSISAERANKLPGLQSTFAQGRPVAGSAAWAGPDQDEVFSYGPPLSTLEYDGSNYPFDAKGRLVLAGSGTGLRANPYTARDIFRTGWSNENALLISAPGPRSSTIIVDANSLRRAGVLPGASYNRLNISSRLRDYNVSRYLKLNANISYNRSAGTLVTRGSNIANVMRSVLLTPATFDNSNGLGRSASGNSSSWLLADGTARSFAPGKIDNPYGLLATLPDHEAMSRIIGGMSAIYRNDQRFTLTSTLNGDFQSNRITHGVRQGFSAFPKGRLTMRNDDQAFIHAIITPAWSWYANGSDLSISLSYEPQYIKRSLNRTDAFGFGQSEFIRPDSAAVLDKVVSRLSHDLVVNGVYKRYNALVLRFTNRTYFSNTLKRDNYINLFPAFSFSLNLSELLYMNPQLKFRGSITRSLHEAPLLYNDWSYGSTALEPEAAHLFYESTDLFLQENLKPETERKFETGIQLNSHTGFSIDVSFYNNITNNFIAPVATDSEFALANAASLQNYGTNIEASYNNNTYYGQISWGTSVTWSSYNTIVRDVYGQRGIIPLAGFSTVRTVLAEGESFGALYGTSYLRNDANEIVIGDDGFPIKDPTLKKIGATIPDWTMGWASHLSWKRLQFSFVFDFRKGGDLWNGTMAQLDYYGRSDGSASSRHISNFIFNGVTDNGDRNTKTVAFNDPSLSLEQNRWVRYGPDGVGESYIEDGSWIRLSELTFSWTFTPRLPTAVKSLKITLGGRNLFLNTPYSGVDPSGALFASRFGSGLDLFNTPATRSYHASITLKI